jgi:hypothetical protein
MRAVVLACLLTPALTATCPAAAAPLDDALTIARRTFPAACSPVVVHGDGESSPTVATYDWTSVLAAGWQGPQVPACEIWLRSDWAGWPWPVLCTAIAHEFGHLSGLPHSPDPANIMFASPNPLAQLSLCGLDDPLRVRARRRTPTRRPWRTHGRRPTGSPSGH